MPWHEARLFLESESPTDRKPWGFFRFVRPRPVVTKKRLLLIAVVPLTIAVTLGVLASGEKTHSTEKQTRKP